MGPRARKGLALMLSFPFLVGLTVVLVGLAAPGPVVFPVALLTWFGGPVLAVAGALMIWPRTRWTFKPTSPTGRLALRLEAAFALSFLTFWVALALRAGPDDLDAFFDNMFLAVPMLVAACCAVVAGAVAAYALLRRHDRSFAVAGAVVFGAAVAFFAATEIGGHGEPGGSLPPATPGAVPTQSTVANGHSNIRIVTAESGQVQVDFDYSYGGDPAEANITSITVTPLGADSKPLPAYLAPVRPVTRGTGHMEVPLTFSAEQLPKVRGFSVCFTAPGHPDLGCAFVGWAGN